MMALLYVQPVMPVWFQALNGIAIVVTLAVVGVVLWRERAATKAVRLIATGSAAMLIAAYLLVAFPECGEYAWYVPCWPF